MDVEDYMYLVGDNTGPLTVLYHTSIVISAKTYQIKTEKKKI
jgi:hypothetical protein